MTTKERALGRLFDISSALSVVNLCAGANTGNRINMKNYRGVTFVVHTDAGTAGDDLAVDLQEHTAATGGTSRDLDIITDHFYKTETTLDGDETWTRGTQTAASEIADVGGAGTSAEEENLLVIEVLANQLSDDYRWVSLNIPDLGSAGTKFGSVIAILWGLSTEEAPENLANPNA